jgi:glycosyltransferase involved in cell wall biosynthesis
VKVLFLIDSLGPGGAERSLVELLPYLFTAGIEASVVTLAHSAEGYESDARATGSSVVSLGAKRAPARIRELRGLMRREAPDLLHTTLIASDVLGRIAARGTGVRVITSVVNTTYDPVRLGDPGVRAWRLRAVRAVDSWTARHFTDHFHAISHTVAGAARNSLGIEDDRITVIERGRDPRRLGLCTPERRAKARDALGLRCSDQALVAVGRHEWQKGHHVLLEALPGLVAHRPNTMLVIAGRTGNATPALRASVSRLGLEERVRFLGHRMDVPEVLAAGDVFVFPSLYEGLGGAVIEAMALGMPIVASDLPALREIVEPGVSAELVPAGAPDLLERALNKLLGDASFATQIGGRARSRFLERFTMDTCAPRMIGMYRRVLA